MLYDATSVPKRLYGILVKKWKWLWR